MIERLLFSLSYSIRHLWREKQRTSFAIFCIAAGVAAIVGLQMLGLLITDTLTSDIRSNNRGDVAVGPAADLWFTDEQMTAFERLVADGSALNWTYRCYQDGLDISIKQERGFKTQRLVSGFLVEPDLYPLYGQVLALDPPDTPLADLLIAPDDVVISKNLADRHNIAIGDQLGIKHAQVPLDDSQILYTVRGIVPTGSAAWNRNFTPLAFGFVYLDYATADWDALDLTPSASEVFFTTQDDAEAAALAQKTKEIAPLAPRSTVAGLRAHNENLSSTISQLTAIVGLLALLIGGIGIVNTMQVVVTRRKLEIAVLKSVGLKSHHVSWLFLTEALLLGLVGGFAGLLLGLAVSRTLLNIAIPFLSTPIDWQIHIQPLVMGLVAGMVVTVVFGFLPALTASQIRPSQILRPYDDRLLRVGCWQSLGVILTLTGIMGLLAGQILDSLALGLATAYGVVTLLTILTGLLRIVVWIIEKLPALGWVSLRLAQRGIGRNRGRAASTLLALIIGLFSVSLVVILANNMIDNLGKTAIKAMGGDVFVMARGDANWTFTLQALESSSAVASFSQVNYFDAELVSINRDPNAYKQRVAAYEQKQGVAISSWDYKIMQERLSVVIGRDLNSNLPHFDLSSGMGRNLTPDDAGHPVALFVDHYSTAPLEFQPGETVTFKLTSGEQITLEIIGVTESWVGDFAAGTFIIPLDVLSSLSTPRERLFVADVDPKKKDQAVSTLASSLSDKALVIETSLFTTFYSTVIQQAAIFPVLITSLALFAAAIMIANTAALATTERRREIGVMKAIGIKGWQILGQLLLESGIIGLVGGVIGVGLVMLLLLLFSAALGLPTSINLWPILGLVALSVGVTLAATLIAAWPASRRRPLDVLRYE